MSKLTPTEKPEKEIGAAPGQHLRRKWSARVHTRVIIKKVPTYARRVPLASRNSVVYFLRAGESGPIKIGVTTNLRKRVGQIQTAIYDELIVLKTIKGARVHEQRLHLMFFDLWIRNEWFRPDIQLLDFIQGAADFLGDEQLEEMPVIPSSNQSAPNRRAKKLSADAIGHIRRSKRTEIELSKQFSVSRSMIGQIRRGERWSELI